MEQLKANLSYMIIEVIKQVEDMETVLSKPGQHKLIKGVRIRDDSINNFKLSIQNRAAHVLSSTALLSKEEKDEVQAVSVIAGNLEHIADHCVSAVGQTEFLNNYKTLHSFDYKTGLKLIIHNLEKIEWALNEGSTSASLAICRSEHELDVIYSRVIKKIIRELSKKKKKAGALVTVLFIFQLYERIGDCLLNIGEEILTTVFGEKLKIHQYTSLVRSLQGKKDNKPREFFIESVGETKSGCLVRKVLDTSSKKNQRWVLFKEGKTPKIIREKENIDRWARIQPTLVPRILGYEEGEPNSSLVFEYLEGKNLKHILINKSLTPFRRRWPSFLPVWAPSGRRHWSRNRCRLILSVSSAAGWMISFWYTRSLTAGDGVLMDSFCRESSTCSMMPRPSTMS